MKLVLGMVVGLNPGYFVLDGDPDLRPQKGRRAPSAIFGPCGQTTAWIKMPLGAEVGFGPDDIAVDGDPAPLPKKRAEPPPQYLAHVHCG